MRVLTFLFIGLISSFAVFAAIYYGIFIIGQKSVTTYKGKQILGSVTPAPTFFLSDAYNSRLRVAAMNDLRVQNWFGRIQPIQWQSFTIENDPTGNIPLDSEMRNLSDVTLRGLTQESLVEEKFNTYSLVQYEFWVNSYGYRGQQRAENDVQALKSELVQRNLLSAADSVQLAQEIMRFFNSSATGYIGSLGTQLKTTVESFSTKSSDPAALKHLVYTRVLSGLAQAITLSFERLVDHPNFGDFLYFSVVAGTTTGYGDILPVSNAARILNAIQILFTYCYLAMLTAKLVSLWIKL